MGAIDADAHVLESPATWSYLRDGERAFLPMIVTQTFGNDIRANDGKAAQRDYWVVGNRIMGKDRNVGQEMTREIREMEDIPGRLRHMDELGIEVQVLYPTLFLRPVTQDFRAEYALARSYNRWLADIWKQGGGRLRWTVMPPLRSPDRLREEIVFGKEHGACGIFMRGLECEKALGDPFFHSLYELAQELDLPVCIHSASGSAIVHDFFDTDTSFTKFKLAVVGAFHSLIEKGVPSRFPGVRWGFIEVSAQWVPYVLNDLEDRFRRNGKQWFDDPLRENNMYVACEVTDDLPYVLRHSGPDNIVIGTDYGHHDPSSEINAIRLLRQDSRIDSAVAERILDRNARTLYGLH
jgi:predicted TIM-barrel fold metal-dependent hydrolase